MINLPSIRAGGPHGAITLGELRELIAAADIVGLSDDLIVRGGTIPFKWSDFGHPNGGCIQRLALDLPETGKP